MPRKVIMQTNPVTMPSTFLSSDINDRLFQLIWHELLLIKPVSVGFKPFITWSLHIDFFIVFLTLNMKTSISFQHAGVFFLCFLREFDHILCFAFWIVFLTPKIYNALLFSLVSPWFLQYLFKTFKNIIYLFQKFNRAFLKEKTAQLTFLMLKPLDSLVLIAFHSNVQVSFYLKIVNK